LAELDAGFPEQVSAYISGKKADSDHWTYRLISSQLDADRIDYMLRDASMAGIKGHGFDLERLLDTLTVHENLRIAADISSIEAVEAYLLMNLHLYRIMYFHKGVRGSHFLLISLIRRCFDLLTEGDTRHLEGIPVTLARGLLQLKERGSQIDLDIYSRLGEHQFWSAFNEWVDAEDRILSDLAGRICSRTPFKAIDIDTHGDPNIVLRTFDCAVPMLAKGLHVSEDEVKTYYIGVDDPSRQGYKEHRFLPGERSVDEAIWIRMRDGACEPVERLHENYVLAAMRHKMHFNRIVYPPEFHDNVLKCMQ
jgi:HD superfamily phosphohydrolase